jgi:homoserine O-succinyltransferase
MNIRFDNPGSSAVAARRGLKTGTVIEIGLVNNVSDAALEATERQFTLLLNKAAGDIPFRLRCFSLAGLRRSPEAAIRIKNQYSSIDDLYRTKVDGLIVTGAEPGAPSLPEESYWPALTEIIDWAQANTLSTIWSCLAAHAAVLHLDGIERRRLPQKCSGIYDCSKVSESWLTENLPSSFKISHSRLNGLDESEIRARGYRMLSVSKGAGVDIFAREQPSQFIFFQGHPEYEASTLQREYVRDVRRYLAGEQEIYPCIPAGYFDAATMAALETFRIGALTRRDPALIDNFPRLVLQPNVLTGLSVPAAVMFRNWVGYLAGRRRYLASDVTVLDKRRAMAGSPRN